MREVNSPEDTASARTALTYASTLSPSSDRTESGTKRSDVTETAGDAPVPVFEHALSPSMVALGSRSAIACENTSCSNDEQLIPDMVTVTTTMGVRVGAGVGSGVGTSVVGTGVGMGDGIRVGAGIGMLVGSGIGNDDGAAVGSCVGEGVGTREGAGIGSCVGTGTGAGEG